MTVSLVDTYYRAARKARIHQMTVRRENLQALASSARSFCRRTRDSELWGTYNRMLKRVIWDLLNTPLPASHPVLGVQAVSGRLDRELAVLQEVATHTASGNAISIVGQLRTLAEDGTDPLGGRCRSVLRREGTSRAVVLVRSRRFREPVEEHFDAKGCPLPVVVPAQLPALDVQETMMIVGQAMYYDYSVLNAPRAENLWVIRYQGLRDIEEPVGLLPTLGSRQERNEPGTRRSRAVVPSDDFLMPTIDWDALRARAAASWEGSGPSGSQTPYSVDSQLARLYILAGGYAVYLESERSSRVLSLDPDADAEHRVQWVTDARTSAGIDRAATPRRWKRGLHSGDRGPDPGLRGQPPPARAAEVEEGAAHERLRPGSSCGGEATPAPGGTLPERRLLDEPAQYQDARSAGFPHSHDIPRAPVRGRPALGADGCNRLRSP